MMLKMNIDCLIVIGVISLFQFMDILQLNAIKKILQNKDKNID